MLNLNAGDLVTATSPIPEFVTLNGNYRVIYSNSEITICLNSKTDIPSTIVLPTYWLRLYVKEEVRLSPAGFSD
jgi:hypothetical protein